MKLPLVWSQCRLEGARWIGNARGQMDCRRHDQTSAAVPFEDEPAQLCNGRPEFKFGDFVWIGDLGCAGAVTNLACVLCSAGTYSTGSGPPRQHCLHTYSIVINQLVQYIIKSNKYASLFYSSTLFWFTALNDNSTLLFLIKLSVSGN